jgi:hypothetical protein
MDSEIKTKRNCNAKTGANGELVHLGIETLALRLAFQADLQQFGFSSH